MERILQQLMTVFLEAAEVPDHDPGYRRDGYPIDVTLGGFSFLPTLVTRDGGSLRAVWRQGLPAWEREFDDDVKPNEGYERQDISNWICGGQFQVSSGESCASKSREGKLKR